VFRGFKITPGCSLFGNPGPNRAKNATFSEKVALVGLAAFSMNGRASGQIRRDRKLPALRKKESDRSFLRAQEAHIQSAR
jgi:hypothetical protein